ncbi:hypothetical protein M8J76_009735 [Diaphorina citri]|nr:hypothetical protein M8J76_009735 [Diaphorina citri]
MMVWERHWGTQRQVCALVSCSIVLTVFYSYLDLDLTPEAYQSGPGIIGLSHASGKQGWTLTVFYFCLDLDLTPEAYQSGPGIIGLSHASGKQGWTLTVFYSYLDLDLMPESETNSFSMGYSD